MANAKLYNNNKNIYKGSARVSYFTADLPIDEDLVDVENIAEIGGDTYFIPLFVNRIPLEMFLNLHEAEDIEEVYIDALSDLSSVELVVNEKWGDVYADKIVPNENLTIFLKSIMG